MFRPSQPGKGWPSDVTLWRQMKTKPAWSHSQLAEWIGEYVDDQAVRTRIGHVAAGLERLQNDGFVSRFRDADDHRIVLFKAVG